MSAEARENGWLGFETAGSHTEVPGGWEYRCDGMPSMFGCGSSITISRPYARVGKKKTSGWLVAYGLEAKPGTEGLFDDPGQWEVDKDVVLVFCPTCALVVEDQERERKTKTRESAK